MSCAICDHKKRYEIENAVLSMQGDNTESIAAEYGVEVNALKVHILMHSPIGVSQSSMSSEAESEPTESLARKLKLREADMLAEVANEYMVTLKTLGRSLNNAITSDVDAYRLLNKSSVTMYLGLGGEIRSTVDAIARMDEVVNGPKNSANDGLAALAKAIRGE